MKLRAQSTIEYMIITALALVLVSVFVSILLNASESRSSTIYTQCQAAAKRCEFDLKLDSAFNCTDFCTIECTDRTKEAELYSGAIRSCSIGNHSDIYER